MPATIQFDIDSVPRQDADGPPRTSDDLEIPATRDDFELLRRVIIERELEYTRLQHLNTTMTSLLTLIFGSMIVVAYMMSLNRISLELGGLILGVLLFLGLASVRYYSRMRLRYRVLGHIITEMLALARDSGYTLVRNGHISVLQWELTKLDLTRYNIKY